MIKIFFQMYSYSQVPNKRPLLINFFEFIVNLWYSLGLPSFIISKETDFRFKLLTSFHFLVTTIYDQFPRQFSMSLDTF